MITLHYYFARELLKTFLMTSLALTLMVVMGGGVANLFKGEGIGPEEVAKVFAFLTPVAITLILPIAALFSATIVYGRASADNEITACRAAGINIQRLLLPALVLGLFVTAFTYWSWNYLIPRLSLKIEEISRKEISAIVRTQFQKARPLVFGRYRIMANRCEPLDPAQLPADTPTNHTFLLLSGVAFMEVDDQEVARFGTADATILDFDRTAALPRIRADLQGVRAFDAARNQQYELKHQILGPFDVPLPLRRKIKFQNLTTLAEYRENPQNIPDVADRVSELRRTLMSYLLWQHILEHVDPSRGGKGSFTLVDGPRDYEITAGKFKVNADNGEPLLGDVRVVEKQRDTSEGRVLAADKCFLELKSSLHPDRPVIMAQLSENVRIHKLGAEEGGRLVKKDNEAVGPIEYMDQPEIARRFQGVNLSTLLNDDSFLQMPPVQSKQRNRLIEFMRKMVSEIGSEIHFRSSYSLSGAAVVVLGALLGIILRGGQVLTAFGVSCIPSMVVVLSSIVGRNLGDRPDYAWLSLSVMWGSTILMYLATAFVGVRILQR